MTREALKKLNEEVFNLNDEELKGYNYIKIKEIFTRMEYQQYFGFDTKKAERHMKTFVELGFIIVEGAGRSTRYRVV